MKQSIPFDTSALISLGHTNLIDKILEFFKPIVTSSVISELKEIAIRNDPDGESANKWLRVKKKFQVENVKKQKPSENELFDISIKRKIPLVIDDIKAIKKYQNKCKCLFSIHIVYSLFFKGEISRAQGILAIQKMKKERSWKENAISVAAKILFE
jgi:hypothetical protein